jgi:hypothetical protein
VLVVYPEYCGGCVIRNFSELKNKKLADKFTVYFDTTNTFILNCATQNKLNFQHIYNKDIPAKFGDYANVVVINLDGKTIELKTNETITKGVHF